MCVKSEHLCRHKKVHIIYNNINPLKPPLRLKVYWNFGEAKKAQSCKVGVLKGDFGHPFSLRQNKYTNVETGTSFPPTIHMGLVYLATRKPMEINHNTWIFCKYTVRSMETYGSESFNVNISSTGTTSKGFASLYTTYILPSGWSYASVWWFQPLWKICSSIWIISPKFGMKIKEYLSCHHLRDLGYLAPIKETRNNHWTKP